MGYLSRSGWGTRPQERRVARIRDRRRGRRGARQASADHPVQARRGPVSTAGFGGPEEAEGLSHRSQNSQGNAGLAAPGGGQRSPHRLGRRPFGFGRFSGHRRLARRDTLEIKAVRRTRLNSTLKSLLFWMVLVVVGVLIWNFSLTFSGKAETAMPFSTFLKHLEDNQVVAGTLTGNQVRGTP